MKLSFDDFTSLMGYIIIACLCLLLAMHYFAPWAADGLRWYIGG